MDKPYELKDLETVLNELCSKVNSIWNKQRACGKTFISLSYFLSGNFKDYFEYITPQEEDLLTHFRKLPPEIKDLYIKTIKGTADTLIPPVLRKERDYKLSLDELKKGMCISSEGFKYKVLNSHNIGGYCYIGADSNWKGFYKIGKTLDPSCRSRINRTLNPNFKILYRTKDFYTNAIGLEDKIHHELTDKRHNDNNCTEWFELSTKELEAVIKKYDFVKMETLLTSSNK